MKKLFIAAMCAVFLLAFTACSSEPCRCPVCQNSESPDLATYSIFYYMNGGELQAPSPVAYNSLTPTFSLSPATRAGYRFLGWSRSESLEAPALAVEVSRGTTGNLSYYAVWGELYSIRVDSASPEFFTIEYVTNSVLAGEVATVHIFTAEPVSSLNWWGVGSSWQAPESCVYNGALGCFVATFKLVGNVSVMVEGIL